MEHYNWLSNVISEHYNWPSKVITGHYNWPGKVITGHYNWHSRVKLLHPTTGTAELSRCALPLAQRS